MAQDPHIKINQQIQPQMKQQNQVQTAHEEEMIEEMISLPYYKAYEMVEKFATTRIGQYVMRRGDRFLQTIETTAEWSLPQDQMNEKLQRPLPWIPFLMMIITLRLARIWLSCAALLIGNNPVSAKDVVYFVQTRRRKLRSLRYRGLKEITRHENECSSSKKSDDQHKNPFMEQIKKIFSSAICRPGQHRDTERRIIIHRGQMVDTSGKHVAKRPRSEENADDDENCDQNLTVNEMLNKYANDNSEDDSDFVLNLEDETNDDSATSSASSDNTNDDEEQSVDSASETKLSKENPNEKRKHRLSKDSGTSMNQSVELKENGNNETIIIPKPMIEIKQEINSDTENIEKLKTAHDNGHSNGTENREADVVFEFVLTPPGVDNVKEKKMSCLLNAENPYKTTSGVESAAQTKPKQQHLKSTLNATTVAECLVPEQMTNVIAIDYTTTASSLNIENSTSSEIISLNYNKCNKTDSSSPTLSAASSSSSLASFIRNETILAQNDLCSSTSSTPTTDNDVYYDLESARLTSVSSSEDDFYSPIGSPSEFNNLQQHQLNFKFNNMPHLKNQSTPLHFSDHSSINQPHQAQHFNQQNRHAGQLTHQGNGQCQQQAQHSLQGHQQHHHQGNGPHQRNRGRNRR